MFFRIFEKVRHYFGQQGESIPMSFVLGFYVSLIVKRWWEQYRLLPWPDSLALFVSAAIPGVVSTCALGGGLNFGALDRLSGLGLLYLLTIE